MVVKCSDYRSYVNVEGQRWVELDTKYLQSLRRGDWTHHKKAGKLFQGIRQTAATDILFLSVWVREREI